MTFNEPQKQNEKTLQNEDVEQFNPKTQINEQKPTKQNSLNSIVEEIVDQIADKVTTKYDTLQTQDTETHNNSQINNQLTVQTQTGQVEQVQNKTQAEPKLQPINDIVLQIKENDSEPETEVLRRNKLAKAPKQSANTENNPEKCNLLSTKNQLNSLDQNIQKETKENDPETQNIQINEPKTVQFKPVQNEPAQQPPENSNKWFYVDLSGQIQGPFSSKQMDKWNKSGKLPENLLVSCGGFSHKLQNTDLLRENFFSDKTHTNKKQGQIKIEMKGENINVEDILQSAQQIQIEVGTHSKQNVTKKSTLQTSHTEQIPKNNNIPKEINDVENPEAESNISGKPKMNKTNLFGDDFYNYDLTYEPVKTNQPQQGNRQAQENNNTGDFSSTQTSVQPYSTHYVSQQQQTQQNVKAQEKQQYYEQNNENTNYYWFDESRDEDAIPQQQQLEQEEVQEKPEQITNSPTEQKIWSESQWDAFRTVVFQAIKNYFNTEFETLEEALVHYRKSIVGTKDGKATKIHLNFKKIANDSNISEKECNLKFQTLLGKVLLSWPEEVVDAVKARVLILCQEIQQPDVTQKKKQIKATIEQEFNLKQQVQYSYKQIQNIIDHILRKLQ
ncbi:GYF_domain [Hexamita inflata]|uniref:GYF domain n=1 Tax=Hexamita inflata TaxID=28002 RepID=A0AA86Q4U9_9EUKA|nr:GYF domain [Hexamita inflata]